MHAASREALAAAEHRLDGVLSTTGADPKEVGEELTAFARLLGAEVSLRRALADPAATEQARVELVRRLVGDKLGAATVQVLETVASSRWSNPRELADGVRTLAAEALLAAAEAQGQLDAVESELFSTARLLGDKPELEQALGDPAAPADAKRRLIDSVFGGKVSPLTQSLIEQVVANPTGRAVAHGLDGLAEQAAKRRERSVAHVTTAVVLTDDERSQLADKLERIYGRPIAVHVEVQPKVLGGIVVKVGDEVIDGSSAGRIAALRGQLAD